MKQHAQAPPSATDFLSHAAPVGLGLLNRELRFVRLNNQLAGLSAKPISEHIGRTFWEIAPGIAGQLEPLCRRVMASGEPVLNREIHGTTPATAGAKRHWLASCYPNKSDQGGLDGVSLVVQEANGVGPAPERRAPGEADAVALEGIGKSGAARTLPRRRQARKRAEQQSRRPEHQLLRAELEQRVQRAQILESLSVLAGGMAHDFNNLLVGILGNASLALMELPPQSPVRPLVEQIEKAGRHAADLTKQMLAYWGKAGSTSDRSICLDLWPR